MLSIADRKITLHFIGYGIFKKPSQTIIDTSNINQNLSGRLKYFMVTFD